MTQHKVSDVKGMKNTKEISVKITQRKIGKIMKEVQKKLTSLLWMKNAGEWREEDLKQALEDGGVRDCVQRHVENGDIMVVHKDSLEPVRDFYVEEDEADY